MEKEKTYEEKMDDLDARSGYEPAHRLRRKGPRSSVLRPGRHQARRQPSRAGRQVGSHPDASTQTPAKTETPTQEPAKQDDQTTKQIPVLMGGALPFTNMQNLKTENYDDGGYYYEDMTQDSSTVIINSAYPSTQAEGQSAEDYAVATATALAQSDNCKVQSCEQNSTYTANLSYPVYVVTFTSGANEDMRM